MAGKSFLLCVVYIICSLICIFTDFRFHFCKNTPTSQRTTTYLNYNAQPTTRIHHMHANISHRSEATTPPKTQSNKKKKNMSATINQKMASTPPTYKKKRKFSPLCSSVKRAMVDAIEREKREEDQMLFKRFRRDAASPEPLPLTEEDQNTLRDNIITSWKAEDVQSVLGELCTLHFEATQDMVHDTLKADSTTDWELNKLEDVQRKVVNVLEMFKEQVEHTRMLRMQSNRSYLRKMQYLYKSLVLNVSRLKKAENVG